MHPLRRGHALGAESRGDPRGLRIGYLRRRRDGADLPFAVRGHHPRGVLGVYVFGIKERAPKRGSF